MYKGIVRRKIRATFDAINRGDSSLMMAGLAESFEYRFHGAHALGGHRTTTAAMTRWWERVFRLLPGARFDIDDILVDGGPWMTRVAVRSRVSGDLPDGTRYENTVFQFMVLRWGRVASIETIEDLQVLERALRVVAASGQEEAAAPPITE